MTAINRNRPSGCLRPPLGPPSASFVRQQRGTVAALACSAAGFALYWYAFFGGGAVRTSADAGYLEFERAFPVPDAALAVAALLAAWSLWRALPAAVLWMLLSAGGFAFLGLIDIAYHVQHDLYSWVTPASWLELALNLYCLGFAVWLAVFAWRHRRRLD